MSEPGIARSPCVSDEAAAGERAAGPASSSVKDGIATLSLERPPLNVLDLAAIQGLLETLARLGRLSSLRALVVRSPLKAFSAGVDVGEHRPPTARPLLAAFHRLLDALASFEAPTIALVEGAALGGGLELALACDLRVVAEEARLALPEVALGVFPPFAALRLGELCGAGRAARLILTGELIDGRTAYQLGIAEVVAPRHEVEAALGAVTEALRTKSASTLRLTKQALRLGAEGRASRLQALEALYLERLMATHDAEEGLDAFLEKRSPKWAHG